MWILLLYMFWVDQAINIHTDMRQDSFWDTDHEPAGKLF